MRLKRFLVSFILQQNNTNHVLPITEGEKISLFWGIQFEAMEFYNQNTINTYMELFFSETGLVIKELYLEVFEVL